MIRYRQIDLRTDEKLLLEFHCEVEYNSRPPALLGQNYAQWREQWFASAEPRNFLKLIGEILADTRNMVEMADHGGEVVGYFLVVFWDNKPDGTAVAQIWDIFVVPQCRKNRLATQMLHHIEQTVQRKGASTMWSSTGVNNVPSRRLHISSGFQQTRIDEDKGLIEYEKRIRSPVP